MSAGKVHQRRYAEVFHLRPHPQSDAVTVSKIKAAIQAALRRGQAKLKGNGKTVPPLTALKTPLRTRRLSARTMKL